VEHLLARGADVNASGRWGITPLHWAAKNIDLETAMVLAEAGAYIRSRDQYGYTALDYVSKRSSSYCWLKWLADNEEW
jgi:ankyrin repeat protein